MKVFKITKIDDNQSFYTKSLDLESLFDGADDGEEYLIRREEMSEEEFEALPEFEGF